MNNYQTMIPLTMRNQLFILHYTIIHYPASWSNTSGSGSTSSCSSTPTRKNSTASSSTSTACKTNSHPTCLSTKSPSYSKEKYRLSESRAQACLGLCRAKKILGEAKFRLSESRAQAGAMPSHKKQSIMPHRAAHHQPNDSPIKHPTI